MADRVLVVTAEEAFWLADELRGIVNKTMTYLADELDEVERRVYEGDVNYAIRLLNKLDK